MPRTQTCVLCTETITDDPYGHNPAPLADHGVCCSHCNTTKVIPARFAELTEDSSSTDSEEDEWEEVYAVCAGKALDEQLGDHPHLDMFKNKLYKDYSIFTVYYKTFGGGPEGGYFVRQTHSHEGGVACIEVFAVKRTWGEPFTATLVGKGLLFERSTETTERRCKVIH